MRSLTNQGTFLLICGIASFRGTKVHGWKIMVFAFAHKHKTAFVEVRQNKKYKKFKSVYLIILLFVSVNVRAIEKSYLCLSELASCRISTDSNL